MTRRPPTLFGRLILMTLPVEAAILMLFGVWLIRGTERRDAAAFDERLRIQDQALLGGAGLDPEGNLRVDPDSSRRVLAPGTRACLLDERGGVLWESPEGWFQASGLRPVSQADVEYVLSVPLHGAPFRVLDSARRIRKASDTAVATGPLIEVILAKPLAGLAASTREFREKAAAVGLALLALTALLLWAAIRIGLHPVMDMIGHLRDVPGPAGTERLAENRAPKELRPLAREINGLLDRLWGLVELEKRFTAEAAHELRTPITLVKSTLQTALLTGSKGEDHRAALQEALEDLQRLERTAESLLTLARTDAALPDVPSSIEEVDLPEFLTSVAERFASAAHEKGLEIALDLSPSVIRGDRGALERLFINLVDNAVKFSARGGTVTLRCASQEESVLAAVEDTGPPIPEKERPHLFQRFFRGTSGRAATVPGAGLGLAIAAAAAHVLGAELTYEPRGAQGNRFAVRFSASARS